ncbi:interleukin-1 beta-like [Rhinophrynus dorsalis]
MTEEVMPPLSCNTAHRNHRHTPIKSEFDEFYSGCQCWIKNSLQESHWVTGPRYCPSCSSGIKMEITGHVESVCTFRKTIILVVAVGKLKKRTEKCFMDTDLLDLLNEIFLEEDIPFSEYEPTFNSAVKFHYLRSNDYRIKDSSNKSLILQKFQGNGKLVALHLQGSNIHREEKITMAFYATQPFTGGHKRPVALGLAGRNLYLSCTQKKAGPPELHLEEVSNIKDIKEDDLQRYIFMKSLNGPNEASTQSFESAAFPGWYISTSQRENELVKMVPQAEQRCIKQFNILQKS